MWPYHTFGSLTEIIHLFPFPCQTHRIKKNEQGKRDSNPRERFWRPSYCHCMIPLYAAVMILRPQRIILYTKISQSAREKFNSCKKLYKRFHTPRISYILSSKGHIQKSPGIEDFKFFSLSYTSSCPDHPAHRHIRPRTLHGQDAPFHSRRRLSPVGSHPR